MCHVFLVSDNFRWHWWWFDMLDRNWLKSLYVNCEITCVLQYFMFLYSSSNLLIWIIVFLEDDMVFQYSFTYTKHFLTIYVHDILTIYNLNINFMYIAFPRKKTLCILLFMHINISAWWITLLTTYNLLVINLCYCQPIVLLLVYDNAGVKRQSCLDRFDHMHVINWSHDIVWLIQHIIVSFFSLLSCRRFLFYAFFYVYVCC